jgi:hypothetical protein
MFGLIISRDYAACLLPAPETNNCVIIMHVLSVEDKGTCL